MQAERASRRTSGEAQPARPSHRAPSHPRPPTHHQEEDDEAAGGAASRTTSDDEDAASARAREERRRILTTSKNKCVGRTSAGAGWCTVAVLAARYCTARQPAGSA